MKFTGYSSLFLCVGVLWLAVLGGFSANADNLRENKSNGGVVAAAPMLEHALDTAASAGHAVLAAIGHVFEGIVEAEESGKPLPVMEGVATLNMCNQVLRPNQYRSKGGFTYTKKDKDRPCQNKNGGVAKCATCTCPTGTVRAVPSDTLVPYQNPPKVCCRPGEIIVKNKCVAKPPPTPAPISQPPTPAPIPQPPTPAPMSLGGDPNSCLGKEEDAACNCVFSGEPQLGGKCILVNLPYSGSSFCNTYPSDPTTYVICCQFLGTTCH